VSKDIEQILAECLEAIEENRLSIEQCRTRYPEHWGELRRLLPLILTLRKAPHVVPSFSFRRDARRRLISRLPARLSFPKSAWRVPYLSDLLNVLSQQGLKPSFQMLAILLVVIFLGTGIGAAYASGDTLPGEALYPIKRTVENLRLLLTFDDAHEARLQIEFAQRRIGEMKILAEMGQHEDIQDLVESYQSLLNGTNETLRVMVLEGDQRTEEIGALVEEALFYDAIILSGIKEFVPAETQGFIDVAIGASKSGNAIARQWVELYISSPSGASPQLPAITQGSEGYGIPLPTDIACWPSDLAAEPPAGVPLCNENQTPVPLPENLILFCWPKDIPFGPPRGIPLCEEGQEPIPLPDNLDLNCWPRELPYDPPADLSLCKEGELPVKLPAGFDLPCWPSRIPYDPPEGIPPCKTGSYPTPAPKELPCWPIDLPFDPPPGLPICEPDELPALPNNRPSLGRIRGGGAVTIVSDIISELAAEYCWPTWLDRDPPFRMPICQSE
jgi:hypothetical protein